MFPTIVEKVEEEEKAAKETARSPPSPLTQLYDGLTLQTRHTWPNFLGDWAYVETVHRNGESVDSETDSETGDGHSLESIEHDDVFSEETGETSIDGGPTSFYLSSNETTPETPERVSGDLKPEINNISQDNGQISNGGEVVNKPSDSVTENSHGVRPVTVDVTSQGSGVTTEPNNNDAKVSMGKRDMHLPLSKGLMFNDKLNEKKEDKENVKLAKKKKDVSAKKIEEKKRSGEKFKSSKKVEEKDKSDKSVKKTDKDKEKIVKKLDSKDKLVKKEIAAVKKTDPNPKEETKTKAKPKDNTKSTTEKKMSKKTDLKDKKTDSPKRKSESKEKKNKTDYISNPGPPILGTARPLCVTSLASKLATAVCTAETADDSETKSSENADVYTKASVVSDDKQCKDLNGDALHSSAPLDLAMVPPPRHDVPFGRYFEEFIFVLCLFTFIALCTGIPSETFVLVILGMHFFYSMVKILGLC